MSMSDKIADMLTRIRNGQKAGFETVKVPGSKFRLSILEVLKKEGYIRHYTSYEVRKGIQEISVELKYHESYVLMQTIKRISKPGRRVYLGIKKLPQVHNGLGISILSTSKGILSCNEARQQKVGGEILCQIF